MLRARVRVRAWTSATSAVTSEPLTPWARSSTRNTRSASPSNARPMSASMLEHGRLQVALVLRVDRVGRVVRERAVELRDTGGAARREALQHRRGDQPAHAVRGVDRDRERSHRVERRRTSARARRRPSSRSRCSTDAAVGAVGASPALGQRPDLEEAAVLPDRAARRRGRTSARCTASGCGSR